MSARPGLEIGLHVFYIPNAGLDEPPGLARVVVGGVAHGQVLAAKGYDLILAEPVAPASLLNAEGPVETRTTHYRASRVQILGHTYRTWEASQDGPGSHVQQAIMALIGLKDARAVEVLDRDDQRL